MVSEFEKDDLARKYFGKLECPFIDKLLRDFDDRRNNNHPHPSDNPTLLVDPNRQSGLRRDHPFTKTLFNIPSEILKKLLEQDKKKIKNQSKEIANKETQERLSALAKAAGKFISEHVEDIEDTNTSDPDIDTLTTKGLLLIPSRFSIAVGEVKNLTLYISEKIMESKKNQKILFSSSDEDALSILDSSCIVSEHPTKKDRLWCRIRVEGRKVKNGVVISALTPNLTKAVSFCNILDHSVDEHDFISPFEFEHKKYNIKDGNKKTIKIFAKYPDVISTEKLIQVSSSDSESLAIRGNCLLTPILDSNYAIAEIVLQARRLKGEPVTLTAKLDSLETITKVKIVQSEMPNVALDIRIVNEPFGNFRAVWADNEGKPNLLKISSQHDSIKRYLGPEPDFNGQNSLHFRVLLAEIVAESVCRKTLEREARERSFRWADQRDDSIIAYNVIAELQKRLREFTSIAHKIMLKDEEIT